MSIFTQLFSKVMPSQRSVKSGVFDKMFDYSETHPIVPFLAQNEPSRFFPKSLPVLRRQGDRVLLQCPSCRAIGDGTDGFTCVCGFHLQVVEGVNGEPKYVLVSESGTP